MDYKLPYDVTLDVEFDVCCSRRNILKSPILKIALNSGVDWEEVLEEYQKSELTDAWYIFETDDNFKHFSSVSIPLKFEVTFAAKGEIDNVSLNGIDINDIVSPEMEADLINEAEKGRMYEMEM